MVTSNVLIGGVCSLRQIELDDCTEEYVGWLNDPRVNKFLETRWETQDINSIREFVRSQIDNDTSYLFAIVSGKEEKHIGNIKIGPVNKRHKHADISYFVGDVSFWRRGIATEAIGLVCGFGFNSLNLNRIEAGAYAAAEASWRALERNGFMREAVFRQQALCDGSYMDVYRYGLLRSEYRDREE